MPEKQEVARRPIAMRAVDAPLPGRIPDRHARPFPALAAVQGQVSILAVSHPSALDYQPVLAALPVSEWKEQACPAVAFRALLPAFPLEQVEFPVAEPCLRYLPGAEQALERGL